MSKSAYAEANGIKLHYLSEGSGPLMLFLHGFPEYSGAWKDQLAEFGKDHLAVAPDMRGYNLSDKPAELERYQMHNLVEDVRALAAALGYARFTLVGHDWGGVVAWSFAIAHPECLDRLIIVNAPHPAIFRRLLAEDPAQQQASRYMQLLRSPDAEQALSANNYAWLTGALFGGGRPQVVRAPMRETESLALGGKLFGTEEDRQGYIAAWSQPGALTGGLNYYRAMRAGEQTASSLQHRGARDESPRAGEQQASSLQHRGARDESPRAGEQQASSLQYRGARDESPRAGSGDARPAPDPASLTVKVPALVIWGEQDTALLASNLTGLEQFVPALTVRRIPDGSHWVIHEQPALVNRYIREFLAGG